MAKRTRAQLMKDVWKLFSEWVRRSNADWRGYVKCVTCPAVLMWNEGIQAGHWIHDKLDFDERNVHPQCASCNLNLNWKKATVAYGIYMADRYGVEEMNSIRKLANEFGNSYSREELEKLKVELKQKLKELHA